MHSYNWYLYIFSCTITYAIELVSHYITFSVIGCGMLIRGSSTFQLSFQMWTNQMQETLNSKKKGDVSFRHKDFRAAIDCYTQVRFG